MRSRIRHLTGNSYSVMRKWRFTENEGVDLFYIDGGHDYWTVKHDFLTALQVASQKAVYVFDDYGIRPSYGVKTLLDLEIMPRVPVGTLNVVDTGAGIMCNISDNQIDHKMGVLRNDKIIFSINDIFNVKYIRRFMNIYRLIHVGRAAVSMVRKAIKAGFHALA